MIDFNEIAVKISGFVIFDHYSLAGLCNSLYKYAQCTCG